MTRRALLELVLVLIVVAVGAALAFRLKADEPQSDCEALQDEHLRRVSAPFADPRWPPAEIPSWSEEPEEAAGRREADAELRLGIAHVYGGSKSGLPGYPVAAGCLVSISLQRLQAAHDRRIHAYIAQFGPPLNARAKFPDISSYVRTTPAVRLHASGDSTRAPGGDAEVALLKLSPLTLRTTLRGETLDLVLEEDASARDACVWWGPPGSDTLFVRVWSASIKQASVALIDLRSGRIIEHDFVDLPQ